MTASGPPEGGERRRYEVTGRVQGVGFRWWAAREARALGLRGTVRNRADGAVELEAAGPSDALSRLRDRLEAGPRGARVERVSELPAGAGALPSAFEIVG
jgi:acylphosphatase